MQDCSRINNEVEKIVANLSQTTHKDNNEGRFENGGRSSSDEERPMSSRGKKNDEQEERISESRGVRNERESKKSCDERRVVRKNSNVRSKNESREERQNDERGNDFRRQAIEIDEDDEEEEAMPPAKKKTTSELAREAYEAYTREIDTNRRLADKMERCMDKFLNM